VARGGNVVFVYDGRGLSRVGARIFVVRLIVCLELRI
jgi:hypothetical protein